MRNARGGMVRVLRMGHSGKPDPKTAVDPLLTHTGKISGKDRIGSGSKSSGNVGNGEMGLKVCVTAILLICDAKIELTDTSPSLPLISAEGWVQFYAAYNTFRTVFKRFPDIFVPSGASSPAWSNNIYLCSQFLTSQFINKHMESYFGNNLIQFSIADCAEPRYNNNRK